MRRKLVRLKEVRNLILWSPSIDLQYTTIGSLDEASLKEILNSQMELLEECRGSTEEHVVKGGIVSIIIGQATTYRILPELVREWAEVVAISMKLVRGEKLNECDELWIRELATASGWSIDDIVEELKNLDVDPSERVERYRTLFENYYREALERKERGDTKQAGEKIWGAVTALIKLYAATKGILTIHWSIGKLDSFVENNIEARYRKLFRDLLDKAHMLHEHFYEGYLSSRGFEERWREVVELIEKIKKIMIRHEP